MQKRKQTISCRALLNRIFRACFTHTCITHSLQQFQRLLAISCEPQLYFLYLLASIMASNQAAQIAKVAPELKKMVAEYNAGEVVGAEAFDAALYKKIKDAGLLTTETRPIDNVAVQPSNREKTMLVPVDCQDLLMLFVKKGWNEHKWKALACTVPSNAEGERWREKNGELVKTSGGLLPGWTLDAITLMTGRGSHGTAALRMAKFGCKSIHPKLAGPNGNISLHKVLELQPSLEVPITKGVLYDIIPGDLCIAVPGLFEVLSRIGNVGNDTFRLPTTLQHCNRLHELAVAMAGTSGDVDWHQVDQVADLGLQEGAGKMLCNFVQHWSGGGAGLILKELEAYERTLTVRRKLQPEDLDAIAKADLAHIPRYVPVAWVCLNT